MISIFWCALSLAVIVFFSPAPGRAVLADPNFEQCIRDAIGKQSGDIFSTDLAETYVLDCRSRNIMSIQGIEIANQVRVLWLSVNQIADAGPVRYLHRLQYLDLSHNQIRDVSPLVSLISVTWLDLSSNQLTDIGPLSSMPLLDYTWLFDNCIVDFSPVSHVANVYGQDRQRSNCYLYEVNCFDSVDNDADGLTDCADPECNGATSGSCITGVPGICSAGIDTCVLGNRVCQQIYQPQTEGAASSSSCFDGLDNDCDGDADCADSGCNSAASGSCDTGLQGVCAAGTVTCADLQQECSQNEQAQPERRYVSGACSDGLDNDCDGLVDGDDRNCTPAAPYIPLLLDE